MANQAYERPLTKPFRGVLKSPKPQGQAVVLLDRVFVWDEEAILRVAELARRVFGDKYGE